MNTFLFVLSGWLLRGSVGAFMAPIGSLVYRGNKIAENEKYIAASIVAALSVGAFLGGMYL